MYVCKSMSFGLQQICVLAFFLQIDSCEVE